MKTILISTDFSANSAHAAEYGYDLARQMKAGVVLCNAVTVPAEIPQAGLVAWPMEEYDVLMGSSTEGLKQLQRALEKSGNEQEFKPQITLANEAGTLADVINGVAAKQEIALVVMGTHANTGLSGFILGNHSHDMIEWLNKPLLLVPSVVPFGPIKKIAFATDFTRPAEDMEAIFALIPFAKALNAEILLTHVYDEKDTSLVFQKEIRPFLTELSNKADYAKIYYRIIKNNKTEAGLDWLCLHGQIDMLVMLHRPHGFLNNLFNGSHTQKMAGHISVPLLVYPEKTLI